MPRIETIKIKSESKSGYTIINETDFDKEVHKKYKEPKGGDSSKKDEKVEEPKGVFVKVNTSPGWWVVKDSEGNTKSEGSLREAEADELIAKLSE